MCTNAFKTDSGRNCYCLISVQDWESREIEGKCNQVLLPNKNIHLSLVAFCISKNVLSSFACFFFY